MFCARINQLVHGQANPSDRVEYELSLFAHAADFPRRTINPAIAGHVVRFHAQRVHEVLCIEDKAEEFLRPIELEIFQVAFQPLEILQEPPHRLVKSLALLAGEVGAVHTFHDRSTSKDSNPNQIIPQASVG